MGSIINDRTRSFDLESGAPCPSPCWYVQWDIRARLIAVSRKGSSKFYQSNYLYVLEQNLQNDWFHLSLTPPVRITNFFFLIACQRR